MTPNPSHAAVKYRPEVDGLRALAVLPVILFHAGFTTFKGGYVGVDVFFVISGYLITSIIVADCESGRFSIAKFYERRVRRILPALLLVTLVCLPVAWLSMLPYEFKDFSTSVVAVSLFASNFLFWRQTDYFATAAEEKPLLHTWSLAVEEQYYLFFPVLFLILWRLGRRRVAAEIIGLLALASLLLAQAGGNLAFDGRERGIGWDWWRQPGWAFFLAPSRAWELFAGALIALWPPRIEHLPRWLAETGAGVGLALVVVAVLFFDSATPTPSIYTLVPVAGTVLLIVFAHPVTAVGSVLARRWLVGIGLISYSAYLWHQPLLAFARIRGEPGAVTLAALCCATLGLAYLTWRYVESPFRDRKRIGTKTLYTSAVVASGFAIGVGLVGYVSGGFRQRFDVPASVLQSIRQSERKAECFGKKYLHARPDWLCRLGDLPQAKPSFMLVGDSHALSLLPAFDLAAAQARKAGVFVSAKKCVPFLGVHLLDDNQQSADCARLSERVRRYISENSIRKLILVARWTYYTDGGYIGSDFAYLGTGASRKRDRESSRAAFHKGLVQTVAAYRALGVAVHVLGQAPHQLHGAADAYHRSYSSDERRFAETLRALSVPRHSHARLQSYVSGLFMRAQREGGIRYTALDELFCDTQSCLLGEPGHSYYFDDDHLSVAGALKVTHVVRELIATAAHPARSPTG